MSTHTPGPWRINDTVASNRFALEIEAGPEGDPFTVCCIEDGTQWVDEDEAMAAEQRDVANAKLIAAAPELLESLKKLYLLLQRSRGYSVTIGCEPEVVALREADALVSRCRGWNHQGGKDVELP